MFRDRFKGYTGSNDRNELVNPILENYVLAVASIGRSGSVRGEPFLDVDTPLQDALPQAVTPAYADFLVEFLAPALDRAHELLQLLIRRGGEKDAPPGTTKDSSSTRVRSVRPGERGKAWSPRELL